jgi:hypothetical protein
MPNAPVQLKRKRNKMPTKPKRFEAALEWNRVMVPYDKKGMAPDWIYFQIHWAAKAKFFVKSKRTWQGSIVYVEEVLPSAEWT